MGDIVRIHSSEAGKGCLARPHSASSCRVRPRKLARDCDSGDHEPVHVVGVDDKRASRGRVQQPVRAIEIDEQAEEDSVGRWAVLEHAQKVRFEIDRRHLANTELSALARVLSERVSWSL